MRLADTGEPIGVVDEPDGTTFTVIVHGVGKLTLPIAAVRRLNGGEILVERNALGTQILTASKNGRCD